MQNRIKIQWIGQKIANRYCIPEKASQPRKEIVIRMPVIIRGKSAQLVYDEKKKQAALTWAEGKINYHFGGTISPQEILRTARSLQ